MFSAGFDGLADRVFISLPKKESSRFTTGVGFGAGEIFSGGEAGFWVGAGFLGIPVDIDGGLLLIRGRFTADLEGSGAGVLGSKELLLAAREALFTDAARAAAQDELLSSELETENPFSQ